MPSPEASAHIVTGSTADVPVAWAREHNVGIVPAVIRFGTEEIIDDEHFPMEDFLVKLALSPDFPQTSAPNPNMFLPFYDRQGPIISVHASKKLSGFVRFSEMAKNELGRDDIYVHDSWLVSMGEGFQAMIAAEMAEARIPPADIIRELEDVRTRTHGVALCNTLKYLQKSGRITAAESFFGTMLSVKPSVHVYDNAIVPLSKVRKHSDAIQEMVKWVSGFKPFERLAIVHNGNLDFAEEVAYGLRDEFPREDMIITLVTKAIAAHAGPDAVGAFFIQAKPPAAA